MGKSFKRDDFDDEIDFEEIKERSARFRKEKKSKNQDFEENTEIYC